MNSSKAKVVHRNIGDTLGQMCKEANDELILVAPFVKKSVLERLLINVNPAVKVLCITRWRPDEIVLGVSDLEVWPLIKKRGNAQLLLYGDLHAKYYRSDNRCMIGSANLTGAALGWSPNSNLELTIQVANEVQEFKEFEYRLLGDSQKVDDSVFDHMEKVVSLIEEQYRLQKVCSSNEVNLLNAPKGNIFTSTNFWYPTMRNPKDLYRVYSGDTANLSTYANEAGRHDILGLELPLGLNSDVFEAYVGCLLLQQPLIKRIDIFTTEPRRFGAMRDYIGSIFREEGLELDPTYEWQTIMRWLTYFLPERYEVKVPNYSEVFSRKT